MDINAVEDESLRFRYYCEYKFQFFNTIEKSYEFSYCFHNKRDEQCNETISTYSSKKSDKNEFHNLYHDIKRQKNYSYISVFILKTDKYNYYFADIQSVNPGLSKKKIIIIVVSVLVAVLILFIVFAYFKGWLSELGEKLKKCCKKMNQKKSLQKMNIIV